MSKALEVTASLYLIIQKGTKIKIDVEDQNPMPNIFFKLHIKYW